ncbi:tetratricopeptide repeat-containing sensor histidine kinase [Flavobacterium haoranii]|uniref:histidine kinase n=1 Tax=Flavobacterium haoranii TaxID=683124 RepID=A0A1M6IXH0_9FLAO|nr:sensor histidine kinase [Flavobacterium haoranii]SHJ39126.1 Tetratricopeptide repeat-containing protein [Flavobacterium haoranii]
MKYLVVFFLLLGFQMNSQSSKVQKLNDNAINVYRENSEKAIELLEEALSKSNSKIDYELTNNNFGIVYRFLNDFEKAKKFSLKSLQTKDLKILSSAYNNIGACNRSLGLYEESIKFYLKALSIYEKNSNEKEYGTVCNNIGMVYTSMELYERAKEYNLKAIQKFDKIKYLKGISESYNNYAIASANQDSLDLALNYFNKSLKIEESLNDKKGISESLNNVGGIYYYKGDLDKALESFLKVIDVEKEIKNYGGVASTYNNIAQVFLDFKESSQAIKYIDSAYFYATKYKVSEDLLTSLNNYIAYNESIEDYKKASKYYKEYIKVNDSILNRNNLNVLHETEVKYQTEKKEREILVQKAKIAEKNTIIISVISLLLLSVLLGYFLYSKQKMKTLQLIKERELQDALLKIETQNKLQEQRLQISRDLHDNIGSQLTFIISSIDNLKFALGNQNPKVDEKLTKISSFTRETIVELRDTIWAMNKEEITVEDLETRISNFIENAKISLTGTQFNFISNLNSTDLKPFSSRDGMNIYRIIQESVNNAIKHGNASKIEVSIQEVNKRILVEITDNGSGFNIQEVEKGNGLNSIQKRASELNGNLEMISNHQGTTVSLDLKKQLL